MDQIIYFLFIMILLIILYVCISRTSAFEVSLDKIVHYFLIMIYDLMISDLLNKHLNALKLFCMQKM